MSDQFITQDSGARQSWDTGSKRDTAKGKGIPSLIPTLILRRLAGLYERGAEKYDRHNWRKGQPISRYVDSLQRHLWLVMDRQEVKDGEDHAAAVIWNAVGIMWTLAAIQAGMLPAGLDDRIGELEVPPSSGTPPTTPDRTCDIHGYVCRRPRRLVGEVYHYILPDGSIDFANETGFGTVATYEENIIKVHRENYASN